MRQIAASEWLDDPDVEPRTEVTAALGRRKTLAVVDNAEHLLEEAEHQLPHVEPGLAQPASGRASAE